jgi:methylenetetrahydrofolate reductase (NADPH)
MNQATDLQQRLESGKGVLLAEFSPPLDVAPAGVEQLAKRFAGKVHALGVSDNRDRVGMAALAAATLVAGQGVEPILHVTTRDRNRIALVSELLGAHALGIRNILCTSGTHQTLGHFRAAKNVYDVDVIQLLQTCANLARDASLVGEGAMAGADGFCLGAVASPNADLIELQMVRLDKKVSAGAGFLVSQPIYDLERFRAWWVEVCRRGLHEKTAILAGIEPLGEAELERVRAKRRPSPRVPDAVFQQVASQTDPAARRRAAIDVAVQTIRQLSGTKGLRGFSISVDGDPDAALEIIELAHLGFGGLGTN